MIEHILSRIAETKEYLVALLPFRVEEPLSDDEVRELLGIYQKYGQDVDNPEKARLYLALDLMPGRTRDDAADFAGLALPSADLDALFLTKDIVSGKDGPVAELAVQAAEMVTGGELTRPVAVLLARVTLDTITGWCDFGGLREQARTLAEFLAGVGEELDQYSTIIEEARKKCHW